MISYLNHFFQDASLGTTTIIRPKCPAIAPMKCNGWPYQLSGKKYPIPRYIRKNGAENAKPANARYSQEDKAPSISFNADIIQFNTITSMFIVTQLIQE